MLRRLPHVARFQMGRHEATKVFFQLQDGALTETVFTRSSSLAQSGTSIRNTVCVSSQIGCRRTCQHCSSGFMNFNRDLTGNEMVGQVAAFAGDHEIDQIVFQGMGEPLDNPAACRAAAFLATSFDKLTCTLDGESSVSQDKPVSAPAVCVSTVGTCSGIAELAEVAPQVSLNLSMMPDAERPQPLEDVLRCTDSFFATTGKPVALSYTMIHGHDTEDHLAGFLRYMEGRTESHVVQLVQYHQFESTGKCVSRAKPSAPEEVRRWMSTLRTHGCRVGFGQYCEFPSALLGA